jgi:hypothetical protein
MMGEMMPSMHVLLNTEAREDWTTWIDKRSKMMIEEVRRK